MADSEPAGANGGVSASAEGPGTAPSPDRGGGVGASTRRTDGGRRDDGDRLRRELDQLEQDPRAYETREQAVIDRYERVLAERRERQRTEAATDPPERSRLGRLKARVLELVGLGEGDYHRVSRR